MVNMFRTLVCSDDRIIVSIEVVTWERSSTYDLKLLCSTLPLKELTVSYHMKVELLSRNHFSGRLFLTIL